MSKDQMPRKILFFFSFFGYSGSEIMLLDLIKSLDRNLFKPYLYLHTKGALLNELSEDIPYYLPYRQQKGIKSWIRRKTISKKNNSQFIHQLREIQKEIRAEVWYINTIAANPLIYEVAKQLNVKVITHVHELLYAYSTVSSKNLINILSYSDFCICCSNAVAYKLNLIGYDKTIVQPNFIDPDKISNSLQEVPIQRSNLGIKDDEFLWIVSARTTYMKGLGYLLEILELLRDVRCKIMWMGDNVDSSLLYYVKSVADIRYPNKLILTGELVKDYYSYFNLGDALLIPSKEESFSLVALEAMYLGLPVLTFEYGAAKEVVKEEFGEIVNSWNIEDLVNGMKDMMNKYSPNHEKKINKNLGYLRSLQVPKFNEILLHIVKN